MKKNDTGEFELVVGDRQLLSAFFDAVGQHRLLVPEQGIEIALR